MATQQVDQITGWGETVAYKAPVRAATTANIALDGEQTIDGVAVVAEDRVLVKNQADARQNGIYIASTGLWQRARDFDGNRDVTKGTRVTVIDGVTQSGHEYRVTAGNPISLGTDDMTFARADLAAQASAEVGHAQEWAENPEDDPVGVPAGGDGSTTYSALHHAKKAEAAKVTAVAYGGKFLASESAPTLRESGDALEAGDVWLKPSTHEISFYDGSDWFSGLAAGATITVSTATGDDGTDYTLDATAQSGNTVLYIGGLAQSSGYTLEDGALSVTGGVPDGIAIFGVTIETVPVGSTNAELVRTSDGPTVQQKLDELADAIGQAGQMVTPQQHQAIGDGTTDDTTPLQAMFDAAVPGAVIYLGGKTYKYSTLTIPSGCTVWGGHLASAKANAGAQITVAKSARVVFVDVELSGGGSRGAYVGLHDIIRQQGTSSTDRAVGMAFYRCYVHGAGMHGLWTRWADDVIVEDCHFANAAYACIGMESPRRFRARGGLMDMLGAVGASANAYGIYLSHNTTNYSSEPYPGTPVANNHFPIDCNVSGVTFHGPEIWEALDFHGGYQMVFAHNKIYACKYGIMAGNSSGDAAAYAGYENIITGNVIDARNPDATSAGVTPGYGITIQGGASGTLGSSWQIVVTDNIIRGYGNSTPSTVSSSIHANVYVDYVIISNNVIMDWTGYGIIFSAGAGRVICSGNIFERMRAASAGDSACIRCDSSFAGHLMAMGNLLDKGGNQPVYGLRNAGSGFVNFGSDFRSAGTEYSDASGNGRAITWA